MTKRVCVLLVSVTALVASLMSGCNKADEYISERVTAKAEKIIKNSDDYKAYQELKDTGMLDEKGIYIGALTEEYDTSDEESGEIPVTFAKNNFLTCVYALDEAGNTRINSDVCYLSPGDSLYVLGVTSTNPNSDLYCFSQFRIWSYDIDGDRGKTPYAEVNSKSGHLFDIPMDYSGSGFSIEPLGAYLDCHMTGNAYYLDAEGSPKELNGKWSANDKPFSGITTMDVSPVGTYTVKYDYSGYADSFYFEKSDPECWFVNDDEKTVVFKELSPTDENTRFAVQLHPYTTLSVTNSALSWTKRDSALISINKNSSGRVEDLEFDKSSKAFDIEKLKAGDRLVIKVSDSVKIVGCGISVPEPVLVAGGYEYTLTVPDAQTEISITLTKNNGENNAAFEGLNISNADSLLIRKDGSTVNLGDECPADNEKVTLTVTPHGGYYISGKNVKDNIYCKKMKFSAVKKTLQEIEEKQLIKRFVSITLDYSNTYGSCSYSLDGKKITSFTISAREGQELGLEFTVNGQYKIVKSEKLLSFLEKSDVVNRKITITADMNGKTIDLSSFGILIEKAG